jgi:hypothetical protein
VLSLELLLLYFRLLLELVLEVVLELEVLVPLTLTGYVENEDMEDAELLAGSHAPAAPAVIFSLEDPFSMPGGYLSEIS